MRGVHEGITYPVRPRTDCLGGLDTLIHSADEGLRRGHQELDPRSIYPSEGLQGGHHGLDTLV